MSGVGLSEDVPSGLANDAVVSRLEDYLARQLEAERVEIVERHLMSGGAIQQNWMLAGHLYRGVNLERFSWVLRTNAHSVVSVSMSRTQEYAVLKTVYERGVKVPRPIILCEDSNVIGNPFFLMEAVSGMASAHEICVNTELDNCREELAWELGSNLALIHQIAPEPSLISTFGKLPKDPVLFSINNCREYLDSLDEAFPVLAWGLRWAECNAPEMYSQCLLHRDFRTGNYMLEAGKLTAILDWEFAGWGDPREDIGWFTAKCWRFSRPDRVAGGVGDLEHFMAGYRSIRELEMSEEDLRFWQLVATLRWAVIALQQVQRHTSGQESSLELVLTGRILPALELDILSLTGLQQ